MDGTSSWANPAQATGSPRQPGSHRASIRQNQVIPPKHVPGISFDPGRAWPTVLPRPRELVPWEQPWGFCPRPLFERGQTHCSHGSLVRAGPGAKGKASSTGPRGRLSRGQHAEGIVHQDIASHTGV